MPSLNDILALPNPLTPLAVLTPEPSYQATVTNYCAAGALAVRVLNVLTDILFNQIITTCLGSHMGYSR